MDTSIETELRQRLSADAERIQSLEHQLSATRRQMEEQLAAKDKQIDELSSCISTQFTELRGELVQTKKRKDRYAEATANRRPRTEPERRKIAQSQGWRCANPDGGCLLPGEVQEYDLDHVIPIWKGGVDEPENLQALCPACHRRKTNRERVERSDITLSTEATGGQWRDPKLEQM